MVASAVAQFLDALVRDNPQVDASTIQRLQPLEYLNVHRTIDLDWSIIPQAAQFDPQQIFQQYFGKHSICQASAASCRPQGRVVSIVAPGLV